MYSSADPQKVSRTVKSIAGFSVFALALWGVNLESGTVDLGTNLVSDLVLKVADAVAAIGAVVTAGLALVNFVKKVKATIPK